MTNRIEVSRIGIHANFHLDEAFAIYLLIRFIGKYLGVDKAIVRLINNPQSINAEEVLKEGLLCVGCGGGRFDEHGRADAAGTCAAELVAQDLGLLDHADASLARAVKRMVAYVKHCDRTADVRPMELPTLLKRWHKRHPQNSQLVLDRTLDIIEDWFDDAVEFQRAFDSIEPNKQYFKLADTGERRSYAVFETENSNIPTVARAKGVDIVIVKNAAGNVRIFTRSMSDASNQQVPSVDLRETVKYLRQAEMLKRGIEAKLSDDYLRGAEMLLEVPFWYYLRNGQMILNGSDQAATTVEPTMVSLNDIIQAVKVGARSFAAAVIPPATVPATGIATIGEVAATH